MIELGKYKDPQLLYRYRPFNHRRYLFSIIINISNNIDGRLIVFYFFILCNFNSIFINIKTFETKYNYR